MVSGHRFCSGCQILDRGASSPLFYIHKIWGWYVAYCLFLHISPRPRGCWRKLSLRYGMIMGDCWLWFYTSDIWLWVHFLRYWRWNGYWWDRKDNSSRASTWATATPCWRLWLVEASGKLEPLMYEAVPMRPVWWICAFFDFWWFSPPFAISAYHWRKFKLSNCSSLLLIDFPNWQELTKRDHQSHELDADQNRHW